MSTIERRSPRYDRLTSLGAFAALALLIAGSNLRVGTVVIAGSMLAAAGLAFVGARTDVRFVPVMEGLFYSAAFTVLFGRVVPSLASTPATGQEPLNAAAALAVYGGGLLAGSHPAVRRLFHQPEWGDG